MAYEKHLTMPGWTTDEIQELFDESLYHEMPELLDGTITYTSQEENRDDLMQNLCRLGLVIPSGDATYSECDKRSDISMHTGIAWQKVNWILDEARVYLGQTRVPGSWPEERSLLLVPGIDFPFEDATSGKDESIAEWPYVQRLLDEAGYTIEKMEKKGCRPQCTVFGTKSHN